MRLVNPERWANESAIGLATTLVKHALLITSILLACLTHSVTQAQVNDAWVLQGPDQTREGYFQLHLVDAEGQPVPGGFTIEVSRSADFAVIESEFAPLGSFNRLSLSGFDDGVYYFRARLGDPSHNREYSSTHAILVSHYPLWQALGAFSVGAILFACLLLTLLTLHRRYRWAR